MASDEAHLIRQLLQEQSFAALTLDERRAAVGSVGPPPAGTRIEALTAAGVPCQWVAAPAETGQRVSNAATEVMLDPAGLADTAALYADAHQLTDPYVSPLDGDLAGLPPLLIHVSGAEILCDGAIRFARRAEEEWR